MAKQPSGRIASKVRSVPIKDMRVPAALVTQREFRRAHGDKIAANLDLDKLGFPVVNHRDGLYWILDGQHRIYALRERGFGNDLLDCEVYENLTDQQSADIFLGRGAQRAISPFDKFHIACTAGHKREADIRRVVESNGVKIGRSKENGTIGAVTALGKVYDAAGGGNVGQVIVGQVIRTLNHAFSGDAFAFDAGMIVGLGNVYNRYNGKTNEKEMAARLAAAPQGVRGLLRRAESQRERTGNLKAQCIAATIVDTYNRGEGPRSHSRLPSWWKNAETA